MCNTLEWYTINIAFVFVWYMPCLIKGCVTVDHKNTSDLWGIHGIQLKRVGNYQ